MKARATPVGAAFAALSFLTAGCSSSGSAVRGQLPAVSSPSSIRVSTSPSPLQVATLPLTGLPASGGVESAGVVAAALVASRGQPAPTGLNLAETGYVEYSDTLRMLALYQSVSATSLGPVGPTRPVDGNILGIVHAGFANAGGPAGFVGVLEGSGVSDLSLARDPGAYTNTAIGLTTSTVALRKVVSGLPSSPSLFTFGSASAPLATGAQAVHTVTIAVPGWPVTQWDYDAHAGRWRTSDPLLSSVSTVSLIVQQVRYKPVQLHHPDGALVPSARVFGRGDATVLSGPEAIRGVWAKPGTAAVTVYADARGVPLNFRPGVIWVLLVPSGTRVAYK